MPNKSCSRQPGGKLNDHSKIHHPSKGSFVAHFECKNCTVISVRSVDLVVGTWEVPPPQTERIPHPPGRTSCQGEVVWRRGTGLLGGVLER